MKTIELTQGRHAIVDDDDFEILSLHKWRAHKGRHGNWYAVTGERALMMHTLINAPEAGLFTDHKDGDGLNNRRSNLRTVTRGQNRRNQTNRSEGFTSRFRGVSWHPQSGKWRARSRLAGSGGSLGLFESEVDAAGAYDASGIAADPEHFRPNFSASILAPHWSALLGLTSA